MNVHLLIIYILYVILNNELLHLEMRKIIINKVWAIQLLNKLYVYKNKNEAFIAVFINCLSMSINALQMMN